MGSTLSLPSLLSSLCPGAVAPDKVLSMGQIELNSVWVDISTLFSSIWPKDGTLSGAPTPGQSGPGSDGNEEVLHFLESSRTPGTSSSDCLVPYLGQSLERSYPSAENQSVYSTAPADWAILTLIILCSNNYSFALDYMVSHFPIQY